MSSILSAGIAVPPYLMQQTDARSIATEHFRGKIDRLEKYLKVFDNALVSERYFCVPTDWFRGEHSLQEKNRTYLEWALKLSCDAILQCVTRAGAKLDEVDHIVFVSSSGIATPSLDVAIINALGLRRNLRRTPLFGLGCAGGAAGIALCNSLASTNSSTVLLVAVELNSLTFQPADFSKENFVATSLFGDGAAAVLISGKSTGNGSLKIVHSNSLLQPESSFLMGWNFGDTGFQVAFSSRVPDVIAEMMPEALTTLVAEAGIEMADITTFIFHPGGKKILRVFEEVLCRQSNSFLESYDVLRRYGNMSSATVLFVLEQSLYRPIKPIGSYALLAAFGPGFSAEVSLLQWM